MHRRGQPEVLDDPEHGVVLVAVGGGSPSSVYAWLPWPITGSADSATTVMPAYTPSTAIRMS